MISVRLWIFAYSTKQILSNKEIYKSARWIVLPVKCQIFQIFEKPLEGFHNFKNVPTLLEQTNECSLQSFIESPSLSPPFFSIFLLVDRRLLSEKKKKKSLLKPAFKPQRYVDADDNHQDLEQEVGLATVSRQFKHQLRIRYLKFENGLAGT